MKESSTILELRKKPLEERTERELELTRIILQKETNRRLKAIQNNVNFFFWMFIVSLLIGIIIYISIESGSRY